MDWKTDLILVGHRKPIKEFAGWGLTAWVLRAERPLRWLDAEGPAYRSFSEGRRLVVKTKEPGLGTSWVLFILFQRKMENEGRAPLLRIIFSLNQL